MNNEVDIYVVPLPEICQECGRTLLKRVEEKTKSYRIAQHCPHTNTLIHAEVSEHEGKRAVIRWAIVGPVDEVEALQQIKELAKQDGVDIEVFHDTKLH